MEEKIKITISLSTVNKLNNDCDKFIFYKNNGELNRNLFLNTLILNYYKIFSSLETRKRSDLESLFEKYGLKKNTMLVEDILKQFSYQDIESTTSSTTTINIKPTRLTSDFIQYINANLLYNSSISSYYRKLFESYASYPQYKREQIICNPIYQKIQTAITKNKKVYILLKNGIEKKDVSIYAIKASSDELYNYLVFEDENGNPSTLRLSKIQSIEICNALSTITKENAKIFEKQIHYGIQYPIYSLEEEPVVIKFTKEGIKMFKKVYLYRPIPEKIEGDIYTFTCSHYQIVYYFKRFGSEAMIIYPKKLTQKLQQFYEDSNQDYQNILENLFANKIMAIK